MEYVEVALSKALLLRELEGSAYSLNCNIHANISLLMTHSVSIQGQIVHRCEAALLDLMWTYFLYAENDVQRFRSWITG